MNIVHKHNISWLFVPAMIAVICVGFVCQDVYINRFLSGKRKKHEFRFTVQVLHSLHAAVIEKLVQTGEFRMTSLKPGVDQELDIAPGAIADAISRFEDSWGNKLLVCNPEKAGEMLRVEVRSAGPDGHFYGKPCDDIFERFFCTGE